MYGGANGFYAVSLGYGPLSLLAGVFTTLLVFNLIFARCLLGERLSLYKIGGACTILAGVVLCILATPRDGVETKFAPTDIESLVTRPAGAVYVALLVAAVLASVFAIRWYETAYPLAPDSPPTQGDGGAALGTEASGGESLAGRRPPAWLDTAMAVVYPGSLGVDEDIAHLTMKVNFPALCDHVPFAEVLTCIVSSQASISMMGTCAAESECGRPTMWIFISVWVAASVATVWWLRTVFTRSAVMRRVKRAGS